MRGRNPGRGGRTWDEDGEKKEERRERLRRKENPVERREEKDQGGGKMGREEAGGQEPWEQLSDQPEAGLGPSQPPAQPAFSKEERVIILSGQAEGPETRSR